MHIALRVAEIFRIYMGMNRGKLNLLKYSHNLWYSY